MKKVTGHSSSKPGHWLFSRRIDLLLLFLPVWLLWTIFFSNVSYFEGMELPLWAWVVFILGLDVSHVWSSLFRSYLVKDEFESHKTLLILTPILAVTVSISLMAVSMGLFWRVMAYLAVFHFIKQQYGFVALYNLKAKAFRKQFISDKLVIYIAALYPVLFWHFNSSANFNWFVENDFIALHLLLPYENEIQLLFSILNWCYWGLMVAWLVQEIQAFRKGAKVAYGKLFWVITTAINWWFAIVYFNSDVVFSISNVVAHGIPYLVLIYYYRYRKETITTANAPKVSWRFKWVLVLIGTVLLAAIIEEYFWDMLLNREHGAFFETILPYHWGQVTNHWAVIISVALLALPQQVHYVMDGFIWKMNAKNKYLKPIFKPQDES